MVGKRKGKEKQPLTQQDYCLSKSLTDCPSFIKVTFKTVGKKPLIKNVWMGWERTSGSSHGTLSQTFQIFYAYSKQFMIDDQKKKKKKPNFSGQRNSSFFHYLSFSPYMVKFSSSSFLINLALVNPSPRPS